MMEDSTKLLLGFEKRLLSFNKSQEYKTPPTSELLISLESLLSCSDALLRIDRYLVHLNNHLADTRWILERFHVIDLVPNTRYEDEWGNIASFDGEFVREMTEDEKSLIQTSILAELRSYKFKLEELRLFISPVKDEEAPTKATMSNVKVGYEAKKSFGCNLSDDSLKDLYDLTIVEKELINKSADINFKSFTDLLKTSDWRRNSTEIHFGFFTSDACKVLSAMGEFFDNLTPESIESSGKFFSKNGTLITASNFIKSIKRKRVVEDTELAIFIKDFKKKNRRSVHSARGGTL